VSIAVYPPTARTLSAAPKGFWSDSHAKAVQHGDYLYLSAVDGSNGDAVVLVYLVTTGAFIGSTILRAALGGSADVHNTAALMVENASHKLWAAYAPHSSTPLYLSISDTSLDTDPTLADGFTETNLHVQIGGVDYTYPRLVQLLGEASDPVYVIFRDNASVNPGKIAYSKTTDVGATWAAKTTVFTADAGQRPYFAIVSDGDTRIDFFTTNNNRDIGTPSEMGHFYRIGTNYYKSDGSSAGALPLDKSDYTLVKDTADGPAYPTDAELDASDDPVILFHTNDGSELHVWQGRWSGSAWVNVEIATTAALGPGSNPFILASAHDSRDVNRVWYPAKVGTKFEAHRAVSLDDGATWSTSQITIGSSADHLFFEKISAYDQRVRVIWPFGTYTSDSVFSFGLRGGY
jgi:hypothetical protein